ncbi:hypothetical protein ACFVW2_22180 [Streptomyces sp. NPDC058171]
MTDLFTVSVDGVEGPAFRGRIHLLGADAVRVPRENSFPVALLADAWARLDRGRLGDEEEAVTRPVDRYPFSAERGRQIAAGMRLAGEFHDLHACLAGRLLRVTDEGFLLSDDGSTLLEPRRRAAEVYDLGGSGRDAVSPYVRTLRDTDELARRAAVIVTGYEIGPLRNVPLWSEVAAVEPDEWEPGLEEMATWTESADLDYWRTWRLLDGRPFEEQPYAEVVVKVTDAGYLEHLTDGMRWSTARTGAVG